MDKGRYSGHALIKLVCDSTIVNSAPANWLRAACICKLDRTAQTLHFPSAGDVPLCVIKGLNEQTGLLDCYTNAVQYHSDAFCPASSGGCDRLYVYEALQTQARTSTSQGS